MNNLSNLFKPVVETVKSVNVSLNWQAYFYEFCNLHGVPISYKGRLLFPDGWMYAADTYAGPEYRPETDAEQKRLSLVYWSIRTKMLKSQCEQLKDRIDGLRRLQESKSAPLQHLVTSWEDSDESPKAIRKVEPLDLNLLEMRLEIWESELAAAEGELNKLLPATEELAHESTSR